MFWLDSRFLQILSDLYVNLSAGWIGSIFILIVPYRKKYPEKSVFILLIYNALFGIMSLITAYRVVLLIH